MESSFDSDDEHSVFSRDPGEPADLIPDNDELDIDELEDELEEKDLEDQEPEKDELLSQEAEA